VKYLELYKRAMLKNWENFEQGSAGRPRMRKDFGYVGTKLEICAGLRREAQDHARIFSMLLNFQKFEKAAPGVQEWSTQRRQC